LEHGLPVGIEGINNTYVSLVTGRRWGEKGRSKSLVDRSEWGKKKTLPRKWVERGVGGFFPND